jgi:hypothetical protein
MPFLSIYHKTNSILLANVQSVVMLEFTFRENAASGAAVSNPKLIFSTKIANVLVHIYLLN